MATANRFILERHREGASDMVLITIMLLLCGFGLAMLFSSSYYRAGILFDDPVYFFRRQFIWILIGLVGAMIARTISLNWLRRAIAPMMLLTLLLLVLTLVPGVGARYLGARRWIFIFGYSFQPSELAKVVLIIYLAHILDCKHDRMHDALNALLPPLIVVMLFTAIIYLQNDFSTVFFLIFLALVMFFAAGVSVVHFLGLGVSAVPIALILLLSREHRVYRILAYVAPNLDPVGIGYQASASRTALTRGGFWGVGLGQSTRKLGGLPEAHSDFVLAVIGEEYGFVGITFVLMLFLVFAFRGFGLALQANSRFASYLALGITSSILFQALFNMAVVSGLVPATGIPLPFFSTGGSSALMTLIMCGLLLNLSRQGKQESING